MKSLSVFTLGFAVAAALFVGVSVYGQEGIGAFIRPLLVDVHQVVPVLADVVVPLEDGTTVTTTVPLTLEVAMQVAVSGVVSESVQVAETEPKITVSTPTPAAQAGEIESLALVSYNELPSLEPGNEGEISIIKTGKLHTRSYSTILTIPVIVRNNTNERVSRIEIAAIASDQSGKMLAAGASELFVPNVVEPGGLSLSYVDFSDVELPENTVIKYDVTSQPVAEYESIRDLMISEHGLVDDRIVGLLTNQYDEGVSGPIEVTVYCFDGASNLITYFNDFTDKDTAGPGETIPFQISVESPCVYYLISARGWEE